jgi:3-hydroxyacyl-[acyl-carrier-protein] dehydratase
MAGIEVPSAARVGGMIRVLIGPDKCKPVTSRRPNVGSHEVRLPLQSPRPALTTSRFPQGFPAQTSVKFNLLDKIESLSDERIVASKYVSLAEEYLADHFPTFPVLPGVMMLEAVTQAAGWLLHRRHNFARSMAVLKEVRNVKYGNFVAPGQFLRVEVEWVKPTDAGALFKASGTVGAAQAVAGRFEVAYFNLADRQPELAELDERLRQHNRQRWSLLEQSMRQAAVAL